ncbi:MAG: M20/M25/M40 family metallo-hydrolase, partial [Pirellulales bacterium]|nr:M20/M25/M40 family metallo-hydrolase [Pirellulales bacterium]
MARLSRSTSKVTRVCAAPSKPNRSLPAGKPRSQATAADGPFEPDLTAATKRVLELLSISGVSGNEKQVADTVVKMLLAAGCPAGAIKIDSAHTRTPLPGNSGNVIVSLPGTFVGPRRLLMAHMDTVPVCLGAKPVLSGRTIRSADRSTGLGADDRAGVCVVLSTAIEILTRRLPHPPLTFFFAIQEEVGLWGARLVSAAQFGRPKL